MPRAARQRRGRQRRPADAARRSVHEDARQAPTAGRGAFAPWAGLGMAQASQLQLVHQTEAWATTDGELQAKAFSRAP